MDPTINLDPTKKQCAVPGLNHPPHPPHPPSPPHMVVAVVVVAVCVCVGGRVGGWVGGITQVWSCRGRGISPMMEYSYDQGNGVWVYDMGK